jgi:hypothetical protein
MVPPAPPLDSPLDSPPGAAPPSPKAPAATEAPEPHPVDGHGSEGADLNPPHATATRDVAVDSPDLAPHDTGNVDDLMRAGSRRYDRARRRLLAYGGAATIYLIVGVALWWHAWTDGASTHTLCGCGDPALFQWFFQWPATALQHGQNPFYSTAMFHPNGINLLSQTSVPAITIPLVPVTWIWGPIASFNVASTLTPALSALAAFAAVRRWATWWPAAFLGGLLYGFSPFVIDNLEFAHLMTAALMAIPLILIALDEILVRQRHKAWVSGLALGGLAFVQFFLSTELLVVIVMVAVVSVVVLVVAALFIDPSQVRRRVRHAAIGLAVACGAGVVLLAWPVWFALEGPGHLSGQIWPGIQVVGGYIPSEFVQPDYFQGTDVYRYLGGYEGPQLASAAYLGWGLLAVLGGGLIAFRRDLRLWLFAFVLLFCGFASLGSRHGQIALATVLAKVPIVDNVIVQRFMTIGFLAAAVMLSIIVDRIRSLGLARAGPTRASSSVDHRDRSSTNPRPGGGDVRRVRKQHAITRRVPATLAALVTAAVALVPIALTFGPRLPFTMQPVILPRWYTQVAPNLPPGRVLLSYPAPFSGIQSSLTWQAVNRMHYSQAGGGGPQGVAFRAGPARAGFSVLTRLALNVDLPLPTGTPTQRSAVRHALEYWQVTTVVVASNGAAPVLQQGTDPLYAASFMTAVLGRLPTLESGAWVWNDVDSDLSAAPQAVPQGGTEIAPQKSSRDGSPSAPGWTVGATDIARCVAIAEGREGRFAQPTMRGPGCVARAAALARTR